MNLHPAINRIVGVMDGVFGGTGQRFNARPMPRATAPTNTYRDLYQMLRMFRYSNRLYDDLASSLYQAGIDAPSIKAFRNPTNAVVQYYVSTLWPGTLADALPIEPARDDDNGKLLAEGVQRIFTWSNWEDGKDVLSDWLPMLGDTYIKVATKNDAQGNAQRVYMQLIEPDYVAPTRSDERGFLTYVRLDIPQKTDPRWYTEVWDKEEQTFRSWRHDLGPDSELAELGAPDDEKPFRQFGIDFVPFVQFKFTNDGRERGMAAILPALDKIIEADQMATRLHEQLFLYNVPSMFLESSGTARDATGETSPPIIKDGELVDGGNVTIAGENIWTVPPGFTLRHSTPSVNFDSHLKALEAHLMFLQETDLPELGYYKIGGNSQELSGRAIRYKLTPAIARTKRVRGSSEAKLIQAIQMALTIAANARLPLSAGRTFADIGRFENGDYEFTFTDRPVIPDDAGDIAELQLQRSQAAVLKKQYGYSNEQLWREDGLSEDEIVEMREEAQAAQEQTTRAFDAGREPVGAPETEALARELLNGRQA